MSIESTPNVLPEAEAEDESIKKIGRYTDIQLELVRRAEQESGVSPEDLGDFESEWARENAENFETIIKEDPALLEGDEISSETLIKIEGRLSEMRSK